MFGMPFATAFAWIGTPIMLVVLILLTFWIEDQRDLTEWEGDPIDTEKYEKMMKGGK